MDLVLALPERAVVDGEEELRLGEADVGVERRWVLVQAPPEWSPSRPRVPAARGGLSWRGSAARTRHDVVVARPAVGAGHLDGHGRAVASVRRRPLPRAVDAVADDAGDATPVVVTVVVGCRSLVHGYENQRRL